MDDKEVAGKSAKSLAFLGDGVFSLLVREKLVRERDVSLSEYNNLAKKYVSAVAQNKIYRSLESFLKEDERRVMKRGRNSTTISRAKNASVSEYRHATGVEALFGYLFLKGDSERLKEIFEECVKIVG